LNPITGRPVEHKLVSVTVLEQSAMLADAYATAFMVMGEEKGRTFAEKNNIRVNMIIREDDSLVTWQNIDEIKIKQSTKKCRKVGGCTYLD
jgi:thiamine biosynthesis lipoprotein